MEKDVINGMMEEDMKDIMFMIIKRDLENIFGKTIKTMKDIGRMINGMDMVYSLNKIIQQKENGFKVNCKLLNEYLYLKCNINRILILT